MSDVLKGLKPAGFFKWFEEITRIPHGSYHEEQLSAFLENFAKERGLACVRDEWNNILIRVPATAGYENEPPILLQGHMDMVWAADDTAAIDLETDALELCVNGNRLKAKGTTLGADDGVAVATMLAIADDNTIPHPELELLCTVQEEPGLIGVIHLDVSPIKARRLINLDAGSSHEICVSAAGGKQVEFSKTFAVGAQTGLTQLQAHLYGGLGGHAGIMSHKNRACCINIMGEMLYYLRKQMPVYLAEIVAEGPSIHGSCDVRLAVPSERVAEAECLLREHFEEINRRYAQTDPALMFEVLTQDTATEVLSAEDSEAVLRTMFFLHTGVRKSDAYDLSVIVTSVTYGQIALKDGAFVGKCTIRSLDDSVREMWYHRVEELLELLGFEVRVEHHYPAWPGSRHFVMQERFARAHQRLFGEEIKRLHLHATIEVNILFGRIPDLDAVGIQPTAIDYHTPDETLLLDEVQPYWDLLLAVLAQKDI